MSGRVAKGGIDALASNRISGSKGHAAMLLPYTEGGDPIQLAPGRSVSGKALSANETIELSLSLALHFASSAPPAPSSLNVYSIDFAESMENRITRTN